MYFSFSVMFLLWHCRDMEQPPARGHKPDHPNTNVQNIPMKFYTIEMEFHIHITYTNIKLSKKFDLFLYVTFCKICNFKRGYSHLCPLAGGGSMSVFRRM